MTTDAIQKQIDTIKKITEEALKTPEAARQLLVDAGIIKDKKEEPPSPPKKVK